MPTGSCLCATVRYRLTDDYAFVNNCHCSMCRKHHGAAFATLVGTAADGIEWLAGEDAIAHYPSSPGRSRAFCRVCGSVAPRANSTGETTIVPAGNLDADFRSAPDSHVFVASKAPWYDIHDALPRFDARPPGHDAPVVEGAARLSGHEDAVTGSCLCAAVRFELSGQALRFVNCHCSRCRRARGAAHASNLFYLPEQLRWLSGEENVASYKLPEAERFGVDFCRICGGALPRLVAKIGRVNVPGGSLDDDPGIRPGAHIYVGSKARWFDIADTLPRNVEAGG